MRAQPLRCGDRISIIPDHAHSTLQVLSSGAAPVSVLPWASSHSPGAGSQGTAWRLPCVSPMAVRTFGLLGDVHMPKRGRSVSAEAAGFFPPVRSPSTIRTPGAEPKLQESNAPSRTGIGIDPLQSVMGRVHLLWQVGAGPSQISPGFLLDTGRLMAGVELTQADPRPFPEHSPHREPIAATTPGIDRRDFPHATDDLEAGRTSARSR
jgi:hypothetical protein